MWPFLPFFIWGLRFDSLNSPDIWYGFSPITQECSDISDKELLSPYILILSRSWSRSWSPTHYRDDVFLIYNKKNYIIIESDVKYFFHLKGSGGGFPSAWLPQFVKMSHFKTSGKSHKTSHAFQPSYKLATEENPTEKSITPRTTTAGIGNTLCICRVWCTDWICIYLSF